MPLSSRVKKALLFILVLCSLVVGELVREEIQYRRSAAYKLEKAAQQLKRGMSRTQVTQILGETELKVPAEQFSSMEVWSWKEERYNRTLWHWMGAKRYRRPIEITAFFLADGLYDVIIENF